MPARRLQRAVAGGLAGFALARIAAADRYRALDAATSSFLPFTPQVTAGAWVSALALRDRRARIIAAGAATAMTALLAPRALPSRQPAATGPVMRVLSANLLVGRASADAVVALARDVQADVLFVQEMTGGAAGRLSKAGLGEVFPYAIDDLGTADSRGNAIYSGYPLSACPASKEAFWAQPVATIELPGGPARLVCVHLNAPKLPWRGGGAVTRWRAQLAGLPASGEPPTVMAGDFNSTLDHAEFRRVLHRGYVDAASALGRGLVPTWGRSAGARMRLLAIDHVLVDRRCAVLSTSVHPLAGTDHRAVLAVIRLP